MPNPFASVIYYVKGDVGFVQHFECVDGGAIAIGEPLFTPVDLRGDMGATIRSDLEASADLHVPAEVENQAADAQRKALGGNAFGTKLYRSWAVVGVQRDADQIRFRTTLYGRRSSDKSWPARLLPLEASDTDLEKMFRCFVTEVQSFLLERDMIREPLTYPDSEGLPDE